MSVVTEGPVIGTAAAVVVTAGDTTIVEALATALVYGAIRALTTGNAERVDTVRHLGIMGQALGIGETGRAFNGDTKDSISGVDIRDTVLVSVSRGAHITVAAGISRLRTILGMVGGVDDQGAGDTDQAGDE